MSMTPGKGSPADRIADLEQRLASLDRQVKQLLAKHGAGASPRQVRLAITCKSPETNDYPPRDDEAGTPDTFWFKFVDGTFVESPGDQDPDTTPRSQQGKYLVHNIAGTYIEEDTLIDVFDHNGKFWTNTGEPSEEKVYRLRDCRYGKPDAKPDLYVSNDLAAYVGMVAEYQGACYVISAAADGVCAFDGCIKIEKIHQNCSYCRKCWILQACENEAVTIKANNDLSAYGLDSVLRLNGEEYDCWKIYQVALDCNGARPVSIVKHLLDCNWCYNCWELLDCDDLEGASIYIRDDLRLLPALAGKTVDQILAEAWVLRTKTGKCYIVEAYHEPCAEETTEIEIVDVHPSCSDCKEGRPCYKLEACHHREGYPDIICAGGAVNADGDEIDLADYLGKVIRRDNCRLYKVKAFDAPDAYGSVPCDCAGTTPLIVTVLEAYDDCDQAGLWVLTKCGTEQTYPTWTDLSAYPIGSALKHANGDCFEITSKINGADELDNECDNAAAFEFESTSASCDACQGNIKYRLTFGDCTDPACKSLSQLGLDPPADQITNADLSGAVGKYVKFIGLCWLVSLETGEASITIDKADFDFTGPYETCAECAAAREPVTLNMLVDCPVLTSAGLEFPKLKITLPAGSVVCPAERCIIGAGDCETQPAVPGVAGDMEADVGNQPPSDWDAHPFFIDPDLNLLS